MKKLNICFSIIALMLTASSCDDGTVTGSGTIQGVAGVASVSLITALPTVPSDQTGNKTITVTALVRDENNNVTPNVTVTFSSSSGGLQVTQPVTDNSGTATAELGSGGDPTNRSITVSASAGTVSASTTVNVTGTGLSLTGPDTLAINDTAAYSIVLTDSEGAGIQGQEVTVTSAAGNTLASSALTTGFNGDVQLDVTATVAGPDDLTATGLGEIAVKPITVSNDVFAFTAPVVGNPASCAVSPCEIDLNTVQNVTINWQAGGVPVPDGSTVNFSSTRGTLSASSATTVGGLATVTISSTNAGPAVISATDPVGGTSTSTNVEFVATTPATLTLQSSAFTVVIGEEATITAVVRDPAGNLVKNQVVGFELTDVTGGFLSVAFDTTDSQGSARTFYTGGSTPSATNGVSIRAFVQGTAPVVEDTVLLTVAGQELFISVGTGNEIFEPDSVRFGMPWSIIVTDAVGNPVSNSTLQASVLSVTYAKGFWFIGIDDPLTLLVDEGGWQQTVNAVCPDEDINRDGQLQPAEDLNTSGFIEAGNVAAVVAVVDPAAQDVCSANNTVPGSGNTVNVITDGAGQALVCVIYAQEYNTWTEVELGVKANVAGTEFSRLRNFWLPGLAEDFNDESQAVPGVISPFGVNTCGDPD